MTMKQLLLAFLFIYTVSSKGFDWSPYHETFDLFRDPAVPKSNFWTSPKTSLPGFRPTEATCITAFGNGAKTLISACQSYPNGIFVKVGCYSEDGNMYGVFLRSCPAGTVYCHNVPNEANDLWKDKYRLMHADCVAADGTILH